MTVQESGIVSVAWKEAWRNPSFRRHLVVTVPILLLVLYLFSLFLDWVEMRAGVILPDPFVAALPAVDFTWPIFIVIYAGLVYGLVMLSSYPVKLLLALQSYLVLVCIRFVTMFVTPLDPPEGIIPLVDPFVQFFGSGQVPTKDLFFSGHTSTLLLLAFASPGRMPRILFVLCALIVGILIVWQHVHYAIDVLVAPFVAYASHRVVYIVQHHFVLAGGNS
jgi:hypothetical protein